MKKRASSKHQLSKEGDKKSRSAWIPPTVLAIAAFSLGIAGSALGLVEKVWSMFRPEALPTVSQEYLMLEVVGESDVRESFAKVSEQVSGTHIIIPEWLDQFPQINEALLSQFCQNTSITHPSKFADSTDNYRVMLINRCMGEAVQLRVLVGNYALRSFSPNSSLDFGVDLAVMDNTDGFVDAYDGFISGGIDRERNCFFSNILDDCIAGIVGHEVVEDVPSIGPGESVLVPLFVAAQFSWMSDERIKGPPSISEHDGLAATPFRFPTQVMIGERVLFDAPRPMHATPTITQGFYEGRG